MDLSIAFHLISVIRFCLLHIVLGLSLLSSCSDEHLTLASPAPIAETSPPVVDYDHIDSTILNLPISVYLDFDKLCSTIDTLGKSDRGKVHAICRWVACNFHYDTRAYETGDHPNQSAQHVWKSGKGVCTGLSNLIVSMCEELNIEAKVVKGYAKGGHYFDHRNLDESGHAWNKIKIDGAWELFDITWSLKSCENAMDWFSVPPAEFCFTHLPFDIREQYLTLPISKSEFEELPIWMPQNFSMGIDADSLLSAHRTDFTEMKSYAVKSVEFAELPYRLSDQMEFKIDASNEHCFRLLEWESKKSTSFEFIQGQHQLTIVPPTGNFSIIVHRPDTTGEQYLLSYRVNREDL